MTNLFLLLLVCERRVEGRVGDGRPEGRHGGQLERLRTHQTERLVLDLKLRRVVRYFLVVAAKKEKLLLDRLCCIIFVIFDKDSRMCYFLEMSSCSIF